MGLERGSASRLSDWITPISSARSPVCWARDASWSESAPMTRMPRSPRRSGVGGRMRPGSTTRSNFHRRPDRPDRHRSCPGPPSTDRRRGNAQRQGCGLGQAGLRIVRSAGAGQQCRGRDGSVLVSHLLRALRGPLRGPCGRTRSRRPNRSGGADAGAGPAPRGDRAPSGRRRRPPDWFYDHDRFGGIITDIASHQIDQFLWFPGSTTAEVVASTVANYTHPDHPKMQDFGEVLLRGESAQGYIRVDWYTPRGLPTWGDGRLIVLGTEGYFEVRRPAGTSGGDHLFLVDQEGTHYIRLLRRSR